ncbi:MAG: hypothetical protein CMM78_05120 [Rhodospirillaceae bacterium]|nr:hypothetical protein [Rhodospirillaceae bacterium]
MLRSLHLAFALLCAALGSQLPAFHDQYLQRVGGALDEVNQQIEAMDMRAQDAGLGRYDYIRRFYDNSDSVIQGEGQAMLATLARQERLREIEARLQDVSWYMLAVEMVFHLEPDIALNTAKNFGPAVPLSISGLAHAFFGFFFGYLIPSAIRSLFPRKEIARG